MYAEKLSKTGGFNFKNFERNKYLEISNLAPTKTFTKTGTTICALKYKNGIVFGADSRATAGPIVADPDCLKVHFLAPNIIALGAGTAGDLSAVCEMMTAELEMQRRNTGSENRLSHVQARLSNHLFRHMGHIGAAIIVGGLDSTGINLVNTI